MAILNIRNRPLPGLHRLDEIVRVGGKLHRTVGVFRQRVRRVVVPDLPIVVVPLGRARRMIRIGAPCVLRAQPETGTIHEQSSLGTMELNTVTPPASGSRIAIGSPTVV